MLQPRGREAPAIIDGLIATLEAHRDPERAAAMAAYMRDQFPFLGIPTPERRRLTRDVVRTAGDPLALAEALWALPEREYQYVATDVLIRHVPTELEPVRRLITTKSWWDTVDALAISVVGPLVRHDAALRAVMDEWIDSEDIWLARTAILHQVGWKDGTDRDVLFRYCLRRAGDREFFLRKAIGWALRSYARIDPGAVRAFVADHDAELSGLSKREALTRVGPRPATA